MSRYREPGPWDKWSDDDPAIQLGKAYLRRQAEPDVASATPARPERPEKAPERSKRHQIADLVARVRAGDMSAVAALRELLG